MYRYLCKTFKKIQIHIKFYDQLLYIHNDTFLENSKNFLKLLINLFQFYIIMELFKYFHHIIFF